MHSRENLEALAAFNYSPYTNYVQPQLNFCTTQPECNGPVEMQHSCQESLSSILQTRSPALLWHRSCMYVLVHCLCNSIA